MNDQEVEVQEDQTTVAGEDQTDEQSTEQEQDEDFEVNLPENLSYDHLEKVKQATINAQRARLEKERAADINTAKVLIAKHGLKWSDVKPEKATRAGGAKVAPKYRDPETGKEWTGRGKAPLWIRDVPDRDAFLIA